MVVPYGVHVKIFCVAGIWFLWENNNPQSWWRRDAMHCVSTNLGVSAVEFISLGNFGNEKSFQSFHSFFWLFILL